MTMDGRKRVRTTRAGRCLGKASRAWPLNQLGFTLIETLVVLAIVSFAAGITLPKAIEQARDKRAMADLRTITVALNIYYQTHGAYPLYLQELTDDHLIMSDFTYRNGNGRYYFYAVHCDLDEAGAARAGAGGEGGAGGATAGRLDHYVLGDPGPNPTIRYDNHDFSVTVAAVAADSPGLPEGLDPGGYTLINGTQPRAFIWGRNAGRPGPVKVTFNNGERVYEGVDVVWLQEQEPAYPKLMHD